MVYSSDSCRQVFLNLLHIRIALRRRGENAGDVQRLEVRIDLLPLSFCLRLLEEIVKLDGVLDGRRWQAGH